MPFILFIYLKTTMLHHNSLSAVFLIHYLSSIAVFLPYKIISDVLFSKYRSIIITITQQGSQAQNLRIQWYNSFLIIVLPHDNGKELQSYRHAYDIQILVLKDL